MRLGAATDLRFGQNNIEFLETLYFNGFSHLEIRKDSDHVYGQVNPKYPEKNSLKIRFYDLLPCASQGIQPRECK